MPPKIPSSITADYSSCQTTYYVGDYFNPSGLVVTLHYLNGTSEVITNYTYSPTSQFYFSGNTYVTISYSTFTTSVPVLVLNRTPVSLTISTKNNADVDYIRGDTINLSAYEVRVNYQDSSTRFISINDCTITYSSSLNYLVAGTNTVTFSYVENGITVYGTLSITPSELPSINLSKSALNNGGLWYIANLDYYNTIPLIDYNPSGHTLSCFITYNQNIPLHIQELNSGLPKGFIISFNQQIVNDNGTYKYIDERGITHIFTCFDQSNHYYYDNDTPLVYLKVLSSSYELINIKGDLYSFDSDGYLISIRYNGPLIGTQTTSDLLTLIIERNNDHSVNKVYYSNDVNTYLQFTYMYGTLTYFCVYQNSAFVRMISFYRSNGLLTGISSTNTYNHSSNIQTLYSFTYGNDGLMASKTDELNHLITQYEYALAKTYNLGISRYQLRKLTIDNKVYEFKYSLLTNTSSHYFGGAAIEEKYVGNELGPIFHHYLNYFNEYVAKYEEDNSYLLTLEKHPGVELEVDDTSVDEGINHKYSYRIYTGLTLDVDNETINDLVDSQNLAINKNKTYYNLSLYLKITNYYSRVILNIYINNSSTALTFVDIDTSMVNVYQKVVVPFLFNGNITSIKIVAQSKSSGIATITNVYISDPVLRFGDNSEAFIDDKSLKQYYRTEYSNGTYSYALFTYNDAILNLKENKYSSLSTKILYLDNGRTRIPYTSSFFPLVNIDNTNISLANLASLGVSNKITKRYSKNGESKYQETSNTQTQTIDNNDVSIITTVNKSFYSNNTSNPSINTASEKYDKYGNKLETVEQNPSNSNESLHTFYEYNQFNELVTSYKRDANNDEIPLITNVYNADGTIDLVSSQLKTIQLFYNSHKDITQIRKGTSTLNIHQTREYDNYFRESSSSFYSTISGVDTLISSGSVTYDLTNEVLSVNTDQHLFSYSNNYKTSDYSINNDTSSKIETNENVTSMETKWDNSGTVTSYKEIYTYRGLLNYWYYDTDSTSGYRYYYYVMKESPSIPTLSSIRYWRAESDNCIEYTHEANSGELTGVTKIYDYSYVFKKKLLFNGSALYRLFSDANDIEASPYVEPESNSGGISATNKYNNTLLKRFSFIYTYDSFLRTSKKESDASGSMHQYYEYTYKNIANHPSELIESLYYQCRHSNDDDYFNITESLTYSGDYNIASITDVIVIDNVSSTNTYSYQYDEFGRISKYIKNGVEIDYTYSGDLLSSEINKIVGTSVPLATSTFSYNSYKQLTSISINILGLLNTIHSYTYDVFGNRATKSLNNTLKQSYTFSHGQLTNIYLHTSSGQNELDFFYDYQGIRIKKEYTLANNTKQVTYYAYDDDKLLGIKVNMLSGTSITTSYQLSFLYDLEGVIGFIYCEDNSSTKERYVFVKNILGDILYISKEDGTPLISYNYTDYGEESHSLVNSSSLSDAEIEKYNLIASINPFRYRSYVYDEESKLYYLFSRYYDPFTHTFISLDSPKYLDINTLEGTYLYCYCGYNPIMRVDPTGEGFLISLFLGALIGAALSAGFETVSQLKDNSWNITKVDWKKVGGKAILGAAYGIAGVMGAAAGVTYLGFAVQHYSLSFGVSLMISAGVSVAAGVANYLITTDYNQWTFLDAMSSGFKAGINGALSFLAGFVGGTIGLNHSRFKIPGSGLSGKRQFLYRNVLIGGSSMLIRALADWLLQDVRLPIDEN